MAGKVLTNPRPSIRLVGMDKLIVAIKEQAEKNKVDNKVSFKFLLHAIKEAGYTYDRAEIHRRGIENSWIYPKGE